MVSMYQPSIKEDSHPMTGMHRPSTRDLPPPNGRYVPAFDQGGLTAQWPVCNGHQSGRPPYSSTRVWLYSCKGCTLVRAWTLRIKQVGPKMEAVDLAWMAV
jgi:hypothetical protein